MAGGTANHNLISTNTTTALNIIIRARAQKANFLVYNSDMKIWIPRRGSSLYPDALVIAEKPEFYENRRDIITNPLLIVEVVSPGSESNDRGGKFYDYRTVPSFREYLLVYQDEPFVVHALRQGHDLWRMTDVRGIDQTLNLESIGCPLNLADIYFGIEFPATA